MKVLVNKKRANPFTNFLFTIPGKHDKMSYDEMKNIKDIEKKEVEVIDVASKKKLGKIRGVYALLKFS